MAARSVLRASNVIKRKQKAGLKARKKVPRNNKKTPQPSRFLELPAELRNAIYEYVALDRPALLARRSRGKLASSSGLCWVSKQVHEEYFSVLYIRSRVDAYVRDFDFAHVVKFLNKLSERELAALPVLGIETPIKRRMIVHLEISEKCSANPEGLQSWLLRCQDPGKKGTKIDVGYTAYSDVTHLLPPQGMLAGFRRKLAKLEAIEKGRLWEEMTKVVTAVEQSNIYA